MARTSVWARALGGAVVVAVGLALPVQLIVFTGAAAAGLLLVRPAMYRYAHRPQLERFGVDALVGKPALVLREVTGLDGLERIGGEEWSARAFDDTVAIPVDTTVNVMEIRGTTAIVYPREDSWRSPL